MLLVARKTCWYQHDVEQRKKQRKTLYASRASLLSEGTLPLEYFPLSTPDASGLQIVVPTILICSIHIAHMQYFDAAEFHVLEVLQYTQDSQQVAQVMVRQVLQAMLAADAAHDAHAQRPWFIAM